MSQDNEQLKLNKQAPQFIDTLKLSKDETYKLSYSAPASMFEMKDTRTSKQVDTAITASDKKMTTILKNDSKYSYNQKRSAQVNRFRNVSLGLFKDKKWYSGTDSPEMVRVKKTVAYLNNLLDKGIYDYVSEEGTKGVNLDAKALKEAVHKAFEEAISACENYLEKKKEKNEGRWSTGVRRRERVNRILQMCKEERSRYELTVDALQDKSIEGFDIEELRQQKESGAEAQDDQIDQEEQLEQKDQQKIGEEQEEQKEKKKTNRVYNMHTLSTMLKHSVSLQTTWQNQGNSTDVYRIVVKENGKDVVYYIKENLPLISADLDGFLTRSLNELASSKQAHIDKNEGMEELRMREAKMNEADYDACTRFLTAIQNKIKNASDADRMSVRKRMIGLFEHDFDKIFKSLNVHNQAARILDQEGGAAGFDLAKWTDIAKKKDDPQYEIAVILLDYMGYDLNGKKIEEEKKDGKKKDAGAQGQEAKQAKEPLKEISEKDWIIKELGLDKGDDKDLGKLISELYGKNKKGKMIEDMFRISLGKEVELFGQMRDRTAGDAEEIAATNNTATSRLATRHGFTDVVTVSDSRIVKFTDRNGKSVERFCTVMREAEGDEFLDILKNANDKGMKIEYTPEAIRQLMRLNAFDMICLQVDRHGRNFKCKSEEKNGKIVISKIMSYDHDMSFGEESIRDTFKDGQDKGFLKNPTQVIKKNSPMYRYVMKNYFHLGGDNSFLNDVKEPDWEALMDECKKNSRFHSALEKTVGDLNTFIAKPFIHEKFLGMRFNLYGQRLGDQEALYKGYITTADGQKLDEDESEKVQERLAGVYDDLSKFLITREGKKRVLKSKFTKEEKGILTGAMRELYDLNKNYDFSHIQHTQFAVAGLVDLWIKKTLYTYTQVLKTDQEPEDMETLLAAEKISEKKKAEKKEALKAITDPKTGDIVIPAMLHFDLDAWNSILDMKNSLENNDGLITGDLKGLGFRDAKIEKLKQRCDDMIKMVTEAEKKAKAFYTLVGWKENTAQTTFFLKKDDYAQISNLSELSVDPGQTYLSIDNENFLLGVKEYQNETSEAIKKRALESEKKKQTDSKRGKNPDYLKGLDERQAMEKFLQNPLSGTIHK